MMHDATVHPHDNSSGPQQSEHRWRRRTITILLWHDLCWENRKLFRKGQICLDLNQNQSTFCPGYSWSSFRKSNKERSPCADRQLSCGIRNVSFKPGLITVMGTSTGTHFRYVGSMQSIVCVLLCVGNISTLLINMLELCVHPLLSSHVIVMR